MILQQKSVSIRVHPWLILFFILAGVLNASAADFLAGADFSHLKFFEERGVAYRQDGQPLDGLAILKTNGVNCVRLRLFTSTAAQAQADPYNYINNLDYTIPLALRAKNAGLQFLLDFHYSDSWADPQKQNKPAAWTNLTFVQLQQQYHRGVQSRRRDAGLRSDWQRNYGRTLMARRPCQRQLQLCLVKSGQ